MTRMSGCSSNGYGIMILKCLNIVFVGSLSASCVLLPRDVGFTVVKISDDQKVYLKGFAEMSTAISLDADPCAWPDQTKDLVIKDATIHYIVKDAGLVLYLSRKPENPVPPSWPVKITVVVQEPIEWIRFQETDDARHVREFNGTENKQKCHM